jgi:hypothetical protein
MSKPYKEVRELVKSLGGKMYYDGRGINGAWVITLADMRGYFKASGGHTFPFDCLYSHSVPDPKTWDHYDGELVTDAPQKLYELVAKYHVA